ncbi:MAG: aconitate hydratase AcnA [Rhodospirillaceae bacterium]
MTQDVVRHLATDGRSFRYYSLIAAASDPRYAGVLELPYALRVVAENLLRRSPGAEGERMLQALANGERGFEIPFYPARVLLQDMLGVPLMVDLAALRDSVARAGGDPLTVNPRIPVDFVVDHSVIADVAGTSEAARRNRELEYARNAERFEFIAWCQGAFRNLRVVPPDSGIVHQVNVERLARVVWANEEDGTTVAYPDTMICNDSHSPMVSGIGVLGWGVGGIEAEAAMLGKPLSLRVPEVLGVRMTGELPAGATATDLVLTITELLRRHGVVGKFVEFYGPGLDGLPVADRATIANMAPEYGATCVYFPVDRACMEYLAFTGRDATHIGLVEAYCKAQHLWRDASSPVPRFDAVLDIDLSRVERCIAGPRRPQERVRLDDAASGFAAQLPTLARDGRKTPKRVAIAGRTHDLGDGDVVIAAITSCTNTSNPSNMVAAALLARNAAARGLRSQPWVKTSFAPGSKVVMAYLERAQLVEPLEQLGFHLVGYGCTTCNGNSGPLAADVEAAIRENELVCAAVLSGNRNFEGRVHASARAAYLASPPLVVAYAIAGTLTRNLDTEPLGTDRDGRAVYLRDVWPAPAEVARVLSTALTAELYRDSYARLFEGAPEWQALRGDGSPLYRWQTASTFLRRPTYFDEVPETPPPLGDIEGMRPLAILGDMVTTDHLAPAGTISVNSPAGRYLAERGVAAADFQNYGFRRGNHEIAMRGAFMSGRLRNAMVPGTEGGYTRLYPEGETMPIYDAAQQYSSRGVPLIVIAGREYGAGSSRDWAAKGPALLGVRVVLAESFERIHRSNLVGMGVLPLELRGLRVADLALDGTELFDVVGIAGGLRPGAMLEVRIHRSNGTTYETRAVARIDTLDELEQYRQGGILPQVYRQLTGTLRESRGAIRK